MAKIDLTSKGTNLQLALITKYHRNKYKQGINSDGSQDPYITTRNVLKRFRGINSNDSEILLRLLIKRNNKLSNYIELNFI